MLSGKSIKEKDKNIDYAYLQKNKASIQLIDKAFGKNYRNFFEQTKKKDGMDGVGRKSKSYYPEASQEKKLNETKQFESIENANQSKSADPSDATNNWSNYDPAIVSSIMNSTLFNP